MERCEKATIGVALIAFSYACWKLANYELYGEAYEEKEEVNHACMLSVAASSTALATIGVGSIVSAVIGEAKK